MGDFPAARMLIHNALINTRAILGHSSHSNAVNGALGNNIWNMHQLSLFSTACLKKKIAVKGLHRNEENVNKPLKRK